MSKPRRDFTKKDLPKDALFYHLSGKSGRLNKKDWRANASRIPVSSLDKKVQSQ